MGPARRMSSSPAIIAGYDGMRDGDAVVMVNSAQTGVRQILSGWLMAEEAGLDVSQFLSKVSSA